MPSILASPISILVLIRLEDINVTKLVCNLSNEIKCSKSTLWNNLRALKRSELIIYSSVKNKGLPVKLTEIGKIVSKELEREDD